MCVKSEMIHYNNIYCRQVVVNTIAIPSLLLLNPMLVWTEKHVNNRIASISQDGFQIYWTNYIS